MFQLSKISKNIIYNLCGQGVVLILGFIAVKFIFSRLGEESLGIIYFTLTLGNMFCAVLELGICSTATREIAAHFRKDPGYVETFIKTTSFFYWAVYFLLAGVIYWAAPAIVGHWINLTVFNTAEAVNIVRILGMASLIVLPRTLYSSLLRGVERMEFNNVIDVATTGFQQLGIIAIIIYGGTTIHIAIWYAVSFIASLAAYFVVCRRFFSLRALIPGYSPAVVRRNWRFSFHMALISILSMIHSQIDKIAVSKLLPIGIFGYYSFAAGAVSRATLATISIAQAALPSFSGLFKEGDKNAMEVLYNKLHDLVCFATLPLFAGIIFAALPLFGYLINDQAARMIFLPVVLLCAGFYINGTMHVSYMFSLAAGQPHITTRSHSYALIVVLPVLVALIYKFGIVGAALSLLLQDIFLYVYWVPRICSECLLMPVWKWYLSVAKAIFLAFATYGVAWVAISVADNQSIISLASGFVLGTVAFLTGSYYLADRGLRETAANYFKSFKKQIFQKA